MQVKTIAGHELTPGKTVKDHIHVEGTELHVPHVLLCGQKPGDWFRKGEKLGEIRDYFGKSLYTELAPEDGVLLYQCASLNIIEKGPMVSYGVPRHEPCSPHEK